MTESPKDIETTTIQLRIVRRLSDGTLIGLSDEFPDHQFLLIPQKASDA